MRGDLHVFEASCGKQIACTRGQNVVAFGACHVRLSHWIACSASIPAGTGSARNRASSADCAAACGTVKPNMTGPRAPQLREHHEYGDRARGHYCDSPHRLFHRVQRREVTCDLARRVLAGAARDTAAGMCSGSAEEETGHRCAVLRQPRIGLVNN